MSGAPPDPAKPTPAGFPTRRGLAIIIVVLGATWTLLSGACTGLFAFMELQTALIFGGPLVLGGVAVLLAGRLLRGDPTDPTVRRRARTRAVVAAVGTFAAIVLAIWSHGQPGQPDDEYQLNQLLTIFAVAGGAGGLMLLAASSGMLLAGTIIARRQAAASETDAR